MEIKDTNLKKVKEKYVDVKERRLFWIEQKLRLMDAMPDKILNFEEFARMCVEDYNIPIAVAKSYIKICKKRIKEHPEE